MFSRGWIVAPRVFETALSAMLAKLDAAIAGDTIDALLERIFFNYEPAERATVKAFLALKASKAVPIVRNYPRLEQNFPCYSIIIAGGQQSQQYLGDQVDTLIDPDTGEQLNVEGERWCTGTAVRTYAEHPDHIEWLHQIAKWGLSAERRAIADAGCVYAQKPSEKDLGFAKEFIEGSGHFVYVRELLFVAEYDQADVRVNDGADEIMDHDTGPSQVLHG